MHGSSQRSDLTHCKVSKTPVLASSGVRSVLMEMKCSHTSQIDRSALLKTMLRPTLGGVTSRRQLPWEEGELIRAARHGIGKEHNLCSIYGSLW